jgi:hypothetical protein
LAKAGNAHLILGEHLPSAAPAPDCKGVYTRFQKPGFVHGWIDGFYSVGQLSSLIPAGFRNFCKKKAAMKAFLWQMCVK